eukprot:SAG11_NODE_2530_length_3250_cov_2.524913_2_plen_50_part_00
MFSIVDLVQVPQHIAPGLYALSHRYDCEQTTQVVRKEGASLPTLQHCVD